MSSYLRVLRHRDFRYLFLGQSASAVGDQVVIVALALYITQRTGSADRSRAGAGGAVAAAGRRCCCSAACGPTGCPRHRIMIADRPRPRAAARRARGPDPDRRRDGRRDGRDRGCCSAPPAPSSSPPIRACCRRSTPDDEIQDARALTESPATLAFLLGPGARDRAGARRSAPARRSRSTPRRSCSAPLMLARVRPRPRGRGARAPRRCCTSCASAGARCARAPGCG